MNLFTAGPASGGPGYTVPVVNYGQQQPVNPTQLYTNPAPKADQATDNDHWAVRTAKLLGAAPLDVVDSMISIFPGIARGSVDTGIYRALGLNDAADYVERNRQGVEVFSGLLGAVSLGVGTDAALTRALTSSWMATTAAGRLVGTLTSIVPKAEQAAKVAMLQAAAEGTSLSYVATPALRNLLLAKTAAGAGRGLAQEIVIASLMQKNSVIWSDDMGQNMLFAGIGIGIGAGIGVISGRAMLARWANSPAVRDAYKSRFDPRGLETDYASTATPSTVSSTITTPAPKRTSVVTAMMLNARDEGGVALDNSIRNAIKDETGGNSARQELGKVTAKGNTGLQESSFSLKDSPEGAHLSDALKDDPTAVLGADSVGKLKAGSILDQVAERDGVADNLLQSNKTEEVELGKYMKSQTPLVLVNKAWMSPEVAEAVASIRPDQVTFKPTSAGISEMTWEGTSGAKYIVSENGTLNFDLLKMGPDDAILAYEGANRVMKSMLGKREVMTVAKDANHFQLDMALEYERRGGTVDWTSQAGLANADEGLRTSMALKADVVNKLQNFDVADRVKLNLPLPSSVERAKDPGSNSLRALLNAAKQPTATTQDLIALRENIMRMADLTQDVKPLGDLSGDMFQFNRNAKGEWQAPVLGYFDAPNAAGWSRFNLAESIQEFKALQIRSVLSNTKSFVAKLMGGIMTHPGLRDAGDVMGLANSQLGGTMNAISHSMSQALSQAQRFRHNVTLKAAQDIRRVVNRATELHIDEVLGRLKPYVDNFSSTSGQKSRVLFNQYLSHTRGWDIAGVRQRPDGFFEYLLDKDSENNFRRLGRPIKVGEVVTNPRTNLPVVLDSIGEQARKAFQSEFEMLRREVNIVREARGMTPIAKKAFYVPPMSTKGKIVGFTIDNAGRVVPGGAIVAQSEEEFATLSKELQRNLPPGTTFYRQEDIRRHADLWERAQLDFIDPTAVAANRGANRGKLSSEFIDPDGIGNAIRYLKSGYEQNTNGAMRTVFQGQIGVTEVRQAAFKRIGQAPDNVKSVYEQYQEALMGIPASREPSGINRFMKATETYADAMLAALPTPWIRNVSDMIGHKLRLKNGTTFDELATQLGPHMPFKDAVDYATQTYKSAPPWKTKDMARAVNRIGSAVVLRWLEIPHAAMNMAGIITNMPGLLNSSTVPIVGRVGGVPIIDQMRIMARGFKRMIAEGDAGWQKISADWDMMVKNGDTSQDVAELHHQLSLIQSKSGFMKFMTGNPDSKSFIGRKGLEGMASIMSDTSESMSRRWAHFVGLELADHHGIVGMEARHSFARQIANDAIANYDPLNRPEIYNSAFGSMYGLFMSYAQNYYQRMFRYLEDADYKSFGIALAAQASMFGFTGIPGARQLADLIGDTSDGDGLVPRIYERLGPQLGSVVAYGGFDQLVTLFGLPPIALHTRGDVNFRSPALDMLSTGKMVLPAGLEVLKDVGEGMFSVVKESIDPTVPMSAQHAAEIMARTMPNRMLRGTLTVLAAGGKESDAYGNLMSETKDGFEAAYRMLGVRSGRQQAEIEAYYMNQKAVAMDAAKMDSVRTATRALIRAGQFDRLPEVFNKYLDAGGKPWNYQQWIRGMIEDSDNTRTANQLLKFMRSPGHEGLVRRIELLTAPY